MKPLKYFLIYFMIIIIVGGPSPSKLKAEEDRFNMSYLFFGSPASYENQVEVTKGSLKVIAPNYFDIDPEGNLDISWKLQSSFIEKMHREGMRVVPFLSNHWYVTNGINGLENREQLAKDIADAIDKYNLDGVNVDIEGVGRTGQNRSYRDEHTDFLRLLRKYIPNDKEVSVAVAANPSGWQAGWHGFYDYKGLSEHVNYLMIMAYDESWESPSSPIGPVASLSFSERSIQYALDQDVPKDKIVLGLPFYGRMWKLDGPIIDKDTGKEKLITGMGLSSTRVGPLVDKYDGNIQFDEKTQSPYATFIILKGESSTIGSTELTEGDYIIWFENERSIKSKLRLIGQYGVKGTGSWALFHETPDIWDFYTRWLNGQYFKDVPAGHWGEESVLSISNRGWMTGTSSTTFAPTANLTRAEGAVTLVRALGYDDEQPKQYVFSDTANHWARDEIEVARELGLIEGLGNNRYGPGDPLTREQLATILYNILEYQNENGKEENPFPDVPEGRWSYDAIIATYQEGHLSGFEDGTFRPFDKSTRVQMAKLMNSMAEDLEALRNE